MLVGICSCISLLLRYRYGALDFDRLGNPTGQYEVGYRKTYLLEGGTNACSIYYPVDKGTAAVSLSPVKLLDYGKAQFAGISKFMNFIYGRSESTPDTFLLPNVEI